MALRSLFKSCLSAAHPSLQARWVAVLWAGLGLLATPAWARTSGVHGPEAERSPDLTCAIHAIQAALPVEYAENVRINEHTAEDFEHSPKLIYSDATRPFEGSAYYASNELDWFRSPITSDPTDVVIGFGTNNAWDIAVRKDAKLLVIADWDARPLHGQEYLMRPLLAVSKTPAEFLGLLSGVPLPETAKDWPLEKIFTYIDQIRPQNFPGRQISDQQVEMLTRVLKEMESSPSISKEQRDFVGSYFAETAKAPGMESLRDRFGPFKSKEAEKRAREIYERFSERYNPAKLRKAGADPEKVSDPFFSFLSSQEAFDRLKKLFDGHVYYAKGSLGDPGLYDAVKKLAKKNKLSRYTVSITNIFDTETSRPETFNQRIQRFLSFVQKKLGPSADGKIEVYQTRRTSLPHGFERFDVTQGSLAPELARNGYPLAYNESRAPVSDFQFARRMMRSSRNDVFDLGGVFALNFGNQFFVEVGSTSSGVKIKFWRLHFDAKTTRGHIIDPKYIKSQDTEDAMIQTSKETQELERQALKLLDQSRHKNPALDNFLGYYYPNGIPDAPAAPARRSR